VIPVRRSACKPLGATLRCPNCDAGGPMRLGEAHTSSRYTRLTFICCECFSGRDLAIRDDADRGAVITWE
jgi:hypothetical protein